MFWLVNLCFFLIISTGSSNIEFTKTLQINYKDDENLHVTVKFQNPVSNFKYAKIQYACTEETIASCEFDNSGDQKHLSFNLSKLIDKYDKADVNVYFSDKYHHLSSTIILLQLVYDPNRSEKPHECLVHCIINFDIKNVFNGIQLTNVSKRNGESARPHEFIKKLTEPKRSNNRKTKRIINIFPNISTYYYFPNTHLTLTCSAFNFPLENTSLFLCKDFEILEVTLRNTLEYDLDLKVDYNSSSLYCTKDKYRSNNITLQLNETYVGSTNDHQEYGDNKNTNNYLAYALEALLAVIGILLLSIVLLCWRKLRAAHSAAPENDVYAYVTSQLTYAQLQLNAHEGKNRQLTKSVPYATVVGVLKPKT